jgi:acetylornithine deacetylase/succinyl-diaminopimelate desuccinylase-like protein
MPVRPAAVGAAAGVTDSRHYGSLTVHGCMRFMPLGQSAATDVTRIHSTDERTSVDYYRGQLCTTRRVLQLLGALGGAGQGAGRSKGAEAQPEL